MTFFKYIIFTFLISSLCTQLLAQEPAEAASINEGSIDAQFEFAVKTSNNYNSPSGQSYEVIKRTMFLDLKANTLDSLKAIQSKLDNSTKTVETQKAEISILKKDLELTQKTLTTTDKEKNSMEFLGMQMSKAGYNTFLWSIIAGLLALLSFFIFKFKNSNAITKAAKSDLSDLETEFKEHRRTALEREQKINRQLQDEINKHRG